MTVTHTTTEIDRLFDVMSNSDRRAILFALASDDRAPVAVDSLPVDSPRSILHHVHLPKLADREFIVWDDSTDTLERGPRLDELRPFLAVVDDLQVPAA